MSKKEEKRYKIEQRCKYFDDLGIPAYKYGVNFLDKNDKRLKKYKKQKEKYGFDSRETWNLDKMFAEWLYTRCTMYLKEADGIVDLEFHKFEYNGKTYTQKQAIKKVIKWSKYYVLHKFDCDETEQKAYKKMVKAAELWAIIFPAMWW